MASNSLSFLLTRAGARLELVWPDTLDAFVGIVLGVPPTPSELPTSKGTLYIVRCSNALLGQNLSLQVKPQPGPFLSYVEYREYLVGVMQAVAANGAHPGRRFKYELLASLSSGYDSPACAAIAKRAGCKTGLTYVQSRDGKEDSGVDIGHHIGLNVVSLPHPLITQAEIASPNVAAEFLATGMQGEDVTFATAAPFLRGKLFVSGFHGDKVWCPLTHASSTLRRGDISGSSLGEFRLRENFLHVPLPFVGATQHASIKAISASREMASYSLGGGYDRPVPRRIAEEAGVPREIFGQRKKAISTLIFKDKAFVPVDVRNAIRRSLDSSSLMEKTRYLIESIWYACGKRARSQDSALAKRLHANRCWCALVGLAWPQPDEIFEHMDPYGIHALSWALSIVGQRYKARNTPEPKSSVSAGSSR
jgi:hypothetical protein